jgi:hypothetical protein
MEGQPPEAPLKVCPHCSVASRTDAETCPSCGKPYGRRRPQWQWRWSWWYAIPIVAAAFAIGFFGLSSLIDGDDSDQDAAGITVEEGAAVPDGIPRAELEDHLDGEPPVLERRKGKEGPMCAYYGIADQPRGVWEFCFEDEKLISDAPIGGGQAPASPEALPPIPGLPGGQPAPESP